MTLPLMGIRVVEFEGIGPGPLAGRMLVDMGAEVIVIARPQKVWPWRRSLAATRTVRCGEARPSCRSTLKDPAGLAEALALVAGADALIEGNRPGVMERLGLGPADCAARNPRPGLWPHDRLGGELGRCRSGA